MAGTKKINDKKKNCFNYTKIWMPILIIVTIFGILFTYHFLLNIKPYETAINKNREGLALAQQDINYLRENQDEVKEILKEFTKTMNELKLAVNSLEAKL